LSILFKLLSDTIGRRKTNGLHVFLTMAAGMSVSFAAPAGEGNTVVGKEEEGTPLAANPVEAPSFYVREYRVRGAKILPRIEVEAAV